PHPAGTAGGGPGSPVPARMWVRVLVGGTTVISGVAAGRPPRPGLRVVEYRIDDVARSRTSPLWSDRAVWIDRGRAGRGRPGRGGHRRLVEEHRGPRTLGLGRGPHHDAQAHLVTGTVAPHHIPGLQPVQLWQFGPQRGVMGAR